MSITEVFGGEGTCTTSGATLTQKHNFQVYKVKDQHCNKSFHRIQNWKNTAFSHSLWWAFTNKLLKIIMLFHLLSVPFTCHGVKKCYFQLQHSCLEQMDIREEKWFSLIQRCFYHLLINLIIYVVKLNTNSLRHFTICHCSQSRNAAKLRAVFSQTDGALQGWTVLSWVALPVWQNWHIASADRLIRLASSDKW